VWVLVPRAFLRRATCEIRRHNPAGDLLFIKSKVTRKYVESGRHPVAIEQEARNQTTTCRFWEPASWNCQAVHDGSISASPAVR
jgi:hypothetical protein